VPKKGLSVAPCEAAWLRAIGVWGGTVRGRAWVVRPHGCVHRGRWGTVSVRALCGGRAGPDSRGAVMAARRRHGRELTRVSPAVDDVAFSYRGSRLWVLKGEPLWPGSPSSEGTTVVYLDNIRIVCY
jgi:hypothetical protein